MPEQNKIFDVNKNILKSVYPKRDDWSRKYNFGHLLVIGGSKLYSGSPAFNALAAYRSGVDLVTIAAPERAANIAAGFSPDLITYPLKGDYLERRHLGELLNLTERKTACVIGGGLGRGKKTMEAVVDFLKQINVPCVIDADAIHAVSHHPKLLENKKFVLTPHTHEFFVLSGLGATSHLKERIRYTDEIATKLKTTLVLKGHVDVISNGSKTAICKAGSSYMTKGGMGDTLAGICGALLARGIDIFTAACAATFINGKAGEIACKKFGEGVTASDLIKEIPTVISK
jgi:hydroxyethylthiazole kinase-like uncharacterized protein yjeF